MKILGLYNNECAIELFNWLASEGHEVIFCRKKINADWCRRQEFDLTVSYTYRYILTEDILEALNNNAVNIHNSLLPWNRGADPNLWSIAEGTPRGVTLHYMNTGLDKGSAIAQEIVDDGDEGTLASSYNNLDMAAKSLFKRAFHYYPYWPSLKKECLGEGSYHSLKDGEKIKQVIDSYNLPIEELRKRLSILKNYPVNGKEKAI